MAQSFTTSFNEKLTYRIMFVVNIGNDKVIEVGISNRGVDYNVPTEDDMKYAQLIHSGLKDILSDLSQVVA